MIRYLILLVFLAGMADGSDKGRVVKLSEAVVSEEVYEEGHQSVTIQLDTNIPWSDFKRVFKNFYCAGTYYITLRKNDDSVDISSNGIENDVPVVVSSPRPPERKRSYFFEIFLTQSKDRGNYALVSWSVQKDNAFDRARELSSICQKIRALNADRIGLSLFIDDDLPLYQVFSYVAYLKNHLGNKRIIGMLFTE